METQQLSNILFNLGNEAAMIALHHGRAAFMLQDMLETDMGSIDTNTTEPCMLALVLQQARTRAEIVSDYLQMMNDEIVELRGWMDDLRQKLKTATQQTA